MTTPNLDTRPMPVACFAPALSDEVLVKYDRIVNTVGEIDLESTPNVIVLDGVSYHASTEDKEYARRQLFDALTVLLRCVRSWWELPESKRRGPELALKHRGQNVTVPVVPLEEDHVKSLWDLVPWHRELDAMQGLFDDIPVQSNILRDCAFHLLWYARELCHDREPLDQSKLPG